MFSFLTPNFPPIFPFLPQISHFNPPTFPIFRPFLPKIAVFAPNFDSPEGPLRRPPSPGGEIWGKKGTFSLKVGLKMGKFGVKKEKIWGKFGVKNGVKNGIFGVKMGHLR